ncbi:MAG TPA: ThuA domain-containing protein [Pirellulales bacterium]
MRSSLWRWMRCSLQYSKCCGHFVLLLAAVMLAGLSGARQAAAAGPVRVLVWDEQQPAQKQAYENFLGNQIADHLAALPGLAARSVRLDDPDQGLSPDALDNCDVLVWWGHVRHRDIKPERARQIVERIKRGQLSLVVLHSGHWSAPFVEAMGQRAQDDALAALPAEDRAGARLETVAASTDAPRYDSPLTPETQYRKPVGGPVVVKLRLPGCCFPAYRADGKPSTLRVLLPDHPIAAGLPHEFTNEQDEMYDEPFHVPAPDAVVLEERWAGGEWFRSGSVWNIGRGKIFYFRPGHETFPVYKSPLMLKVIENAVRWLGAERAAGK